MGRHLRSPRKHRDREGWGVPERSRRGWASLLASRIQVSGVGWPPTRRRQARTRRPSEGQASSLGSAASRGWMPATRPKPVGTAIDQGRPSLGQACLGAFVSIAAADPASSPRGCRCSWFQQPAPGSSRAPSERQNLCQGRLFHGRPSARQYCYPASPTRQRGSQSLQDGTPPPSRRSGAAVGLRYGHRQVVVGPA